MVEKKYISFHISFHFANHPHVREIFSGIIVSACRQLPLTCVCRTLWGKKAVLAKVFCYQNAKISYAFFISNMHITNFICFLHIKHAYNKFHLLSSHQTCIQQISYAFFISNIHAAFFISNMRNKFHILSSYRSNMHYITSLQKFELNIYTESKQLIRITKTFNRKMKFYAKQYLKKL